MSSLLEKVTRLIALAASPVEEEARTSAVKACRLILEHGLVVSEKWQVARASNGHDRNGCDGDPMDIFRRGPKVETPRSKWSPQKHQAPPPEEPEVKVIKSKKPGLCRSCGKPFAKGEWVRWWQGTKRCQHHPECGAQGTMF